jgi:hypothetical protein
MDWNRICELLVTISLDVFVGPYGD